MAPRKLLVLGGTGFIGREFISRWITQHGGGGVQVIVPSRRPISPAHPQARALAMLPGVTLVRAHVDRDVDLARLVHGCDAVINLVAILHGSRQAFQRTHVELPRRLAEACIEAKVSHLLHVSALGVTDPLKPAPSDYLRSKTAGEGALLAAYAKPGSGALTILRPSVVFGAEDRFINLFASLQALLPLMPLAGGSARFQPVWVRDVADAMARCLTGATGSIAPARPGKPLVLECAGPRIWTLSELVRAAGAWSGHPRPQLPLPIWAGYAQALAFGLLPGEPLMSIDNLRSMRVPNVATAGHPGLNEIGIVPAELVGVMAPHLARGG